MLFFLFLNCVQIFIALVSCEAARSPQLASFSGPTVPIYVVNTEQLGLSRSDEKTVDATKVKDILDKSTPLQIISMEDSIRDGRLPIGINGRQDAASLNSTHNPAGDQKNGTVNAVPSKKCVNPWLVEDPCNYARINCDFDSHLMNYLAFYYCNLFKDTAAPTNDMNHKGEDRRKNNRGGLFGYIMAMIPIIILFFLILYLTANDHLTPALSLISNYLRLSPTVAGVTLLSFGNGAPDFFTSLMGTQDVDTVGLILGGSIGGGMFVTCFVFGMVILAFHKYHQPSNVASLPVADGPVKPSRLERRKTSWLWRIGGWRKIRRRHKNNPKVQSAELSSIDTEPPSVSSSEHRAVSDNTPINSPPRPASPSVMRPTNSSNVSLVASIRSAQAGMHDLSHEEAARHPSKSSLGPSPKEATSAKSLIKESSNFSKPDKVASTESTPLLSPYSTIKHFVLYILAILMLVIIASLHYIPIWIPIVMLTLYSLNIISIFAYEFYLYCKKLHAKPHPENAPLPFKKKLVKFYHTIIGALVRPKRDKLDLSIYVILKLLFKGWLRDFKKQTLLEQLGTVICMPVQIVISLSIPPLFLSDDDDYNDDDAENGNDALVDEDDDHMVVSQHNEQSDVESGLKVNEGTSSSPPMTSSKTDQQEAVSRDYNIPKITYTNASDPSLTAPISSSPAIEPTLLDSYFYIDRLRLVFNPFFSLALLCSFFSLWNTRLLPDLPAYVLYLIVSPYLSIIFYLTSSYRRVPAYRPFLALASFSTCIIWIYGISSEIVNIFQGLGVLFPSVSQTSLGLTVLAWGNSFGDLVVDVAIATTINATPGQSIIEKPLEGSNLDKDAATEPAAKPALKVATVEATSSTDAEPKIASDSKDKVDAVQENGSSDPSTTQAEASGPSIDEPVIEPSNTSKAAFETAFTGVICGPLQNVMLSLATCLLKLVIVNSQDASPATTTRFLADPVLYFSMSLLLCTLLLSFFMITMVWKMKKIPQWYGWFLLGVYVLVFLPMVVFGGVGAIPGWNIGR